MECVHDNYLCAVNRVISFSFVLLYLIALGRPIAPLLEYYARQEYFAEVLCVNKAKPELKCNGQCALSKKIKEATQSETSPVLPKINFEDYPIGIVSRFEHEVAVAVDPVPAGRYLIGDYLFFPAKNCKPPSA